MASLDPAAGATPAPPLARKRTGTVSTELSEATSQLLHVSLDIHLPSQQPQPTPRRRGDSSAGGQDSRLWRRKSVEELRVPPGYKGAIAVDGRGARGGGSSGLGSGSREGGAAARAEAGQARDTAGRRTPTLYPFAGSQHLLRRANSVEELLARDDEEEEDDSLDEGFTSDEEPFRCRPPSIASSNTSQRSSRFGVRLEDRSDQACDVFARDVKICGFHPVGAQNSGGFVVFDIEIHTREGTLIKAHKRYSAFVRLRSDLITAFPRLKTLIPRLPPKSSLAKYRPSFLERRRQQLSYWLTTVLLHPETGSSALLRKWVLE